MTSGWRAQQRRRGLVRALLLGVFIAIVLLPLVWTGLAAIGIEPNNNTSPPSWVLAPSLDHLAEVSVVEPAFWQELATSVGVSAAAAILATALSFLAAYGIARTRGRTVRRLGPILFQLPPNLKKDTGRLRAFIDTLPADRRYTIEFRHESWFEDDVFDALRERDIPMCVTEQPDFASPLVSTASWGYTRLHRLDYTDAMLAEWSKKISAQPWTEAFVFFKHDEGIGSGPPAVGAFMNTFSA